jgi:hypothetical protein
VFFAFSLYYFLLCVWVVFCFFSYTFKIYVSSDKQDKMSNMVECFIEKHINLYSPLIKKMYFYYPNYRSINSLVPKRYTLIKVVIYSQNDDKI